MNPWKSRIYSECKQWVSQKEKVLKDAAVQNFGSFQGEVGTLAPSCYNSALEVKRYEPPI
jgi:hypothetical protein